MYEVYYEILSQINRLYKLDKNKEEIIRVVFTQKSTVVGRYSTLITVSTM